MAFDNVNVSELRSNASECRGSLNSKATNECLSMISDNNIWDSAAKAPLQEALNGIQSLYSELQSLFALYMKIVAKLEEYQNLKSEIASLESKISSMQSRLSSIEDEAKRTRLEMQISNLKGMLITKRKQLEQLEAEINQLAGI